MLQRLIREDVTLHVQLHPEPLYTQADAGMLDQILLNLAVNARDAMPEGGRLIIATSAATVDEGEAASFPDVKPGSYVCLTVEDTGAGIPPEVLPHIFEPFFTTKEPGQGSGLGLATVFGIVKQHRGILKVDSAPGGGTRFQVFLPASEKGRGPRASQAMPKPRRGTETILLVEDEAPVRSLTRTILERHGYSVLDCANGMEALALWKSHRTAVSLLLTDLVMPSELSGSELSRRLREEKPRLQVIYMSGYSSEFAGRQMDLRPGENFLQKPFSPDQLLEAVRRMPDA
jgi:CheY-like chemotaxis protein